MDFVRITFLLNITIVPISFALIGAPRKDGQEKPVIWIDAGIHAREWVTIATATYIIYQVI